jgi:hypothetical protein
VFFLSTTWSGIKFFHSKKAVAKVKATEKEKVKICCVRLNTVHEFPPTWFT